MRKKFAALLLTALLTLSLCVPAFAEDEPGYVTDLAGLLTGEEAAELERQAREISELYDCGVYIVTVEDFTEYADTDDVDEAAQEIYLSDENSFGMGGDKSGVLLLLSMAERDFCLYVYGYGNTAFTDYGKDRLAESFVDDFGDDDWYGGFEDYLEVSGELLKSARNGSPIDKPEPSAAFTRLIFISILISGIISLAAAVFSIVCMWKIFVKAGEPGWAAIIPGYNLYVEYKITWGNGVYFLFSLIPLANFVLGIITLVKLARAFGKGGGFAVGLIFLSPIFMAILAFSSARYQGAPDKSAPQAAYAYPQNEQIYQNQGVPQNQGYSQAPQQGAYRQPQPQPQPERQNVRCPCCGYPLPLGAKFCPNCGKNYRENVLTDIKK